MGTMPSVSFTHRIDTELKTELERIAKYDDRSAAYVANQAIKNFVEERQATRELVDTGLALVEMGGPSLPAEDIHNWLLAEEDQPFPNPHSAN